MPVTIVFSTGNTRDFPTAADILARGGMLKVLAADGKEIHSFDASQVVSVRVNGKDIEWPQS